MSTRPPSPILIVEDEIFVALEIEALLGDGGYDICAIAVDRCEALAMAAHCSFAFIDVNLRDGMTGPEIASELYERFGIHSIFVTANPGQIGDDVDGAIAYVRKPFDRDAILAAAAWAAAPENVPSNTNVVPLVTISSGGTATRSGA